MPCKKFFFSESFKYHTIFFVFSFISTAKLKEFSYLQLNALEIINLEVFRAALRAA